MRYFEKHPMTMIVIGILGISVSSILVRYSDAPSAVTAVWRLLWTVIFMTPAILSSPSARTEIKNLPLKTLSLCIFSGLALAVHFVLWFESLAHTSVASSTAIVCTEVIWVALGFRFFLKGRISGIAAADIAVTVLGSLMIAWADSGAGGRLYGDILALIAAIAVAVYTLLGRQVQKTTSTGVYTYVLYLSCTAALLFTCLVQGHRLMAWGLRTPLVGACLALFSTILGHSVFSWCLKYFSPAFVSASKLCEPVAAAVLAGILFGEIPGFVQVLGGILILGGVYAYSREERKNL